MVDGTPTYIFSTWALDPLLDPMMVLLVLGWLVTATTLALRNGAMDRPSRVAQLYGYTVCLIALITILFTLPNLIETVFRLNDPLHADGQFEPALSSFDLTKPPMSALPSSGKARRTPARVPATKSCGVNTKHYEPTESRRTLLRVVDPSSASSCSWGLL
jgi:hypothetical protein